MPCQTRNMDKLAVMGSLQFAVRSMQFAQRPPKLKAKVEWAVHSSQFRALSGAALSPAEVSKGRCSPFAFFLSPFAITIENRDAIKRVSTRSGPV
jgi:hypothetical protein